MVHALTTESKQQSDKTRTYSGLRPERELHRRLSALAAPHQRLGIAGGVPDLSVGAQRRQHFAGLQSAYGNQAVLRMLDSSGPVQRTTSSRVASGVFQSKCACGGSCPHCRARAAAQPELRVNAPDDQLERESDRISDAGLDATEPHLGKTLGGPGPVAIGSVVGGSHVQRKCACGRSPGGEGPCDGCGEEQRVLLQRAPARGEVPFDGVPPIVNHVLRSPGQPLDQATRVFFELRFGHDFSPVRVHTDDQAAASARAVNAQAYTVGYEIAFAAGRYTPDTAAGRLLLAHELTHVVQQSPVLSRYPDTRSHSSPKKGATASRRVGALAALLESYAKRADMRIAASGMSGEGLEWIRSDIADLKVGVQRLREVAASRDDKVSAAVLSGFTPARLKEASRHLEPALASLPVAVAKHVPVSIAAKPLSIDQPYSPAEAEADRVAAAVMSNQAVTPAPGSQRLAIQRYLDAAAEAAMEAELSNVAELTVAPEVAVVGTEAAVTGTEAALATEVAVVGTEAAVTGTEAALATAGTVAAVGGPPGWVIGLAIVAVVGIVAVGGYLYYRSRKEKAQFAPLPQPLPTPAPTPTPRSEPPSECVEQARRLSTPDCTVTAMAIPAGGDPLATLFCEEKTGSQCEYSVLSTAGRAFFDAIRGRDVIECKCGYQPLLDAIRRGEPWAQPRLDKLLEQVLRHLRVTRQCGLQYRIIVSNSALAALLRRILGANVDIIVEPFEPCD